MRLHFAFSPSSSSRALSRVALRTTFAIGLLIGGTNAGGNAVANGDTRTLSIHHMHTGESLTVTYKQNGSFDRDALEKLNWLLRDWRRDEPTSMDPRLFDIIWEAHRQVGSNEPIQVVSAYRSPETNAMLRRRSSAVAKNSQHMLGKAMDFYLPDVSVDQIREIGLKMQRGGVGYYPNSYTPFVHLDAGSVRHWPRMSHDELARLFPDGKTVHIPSDGRPLEHYAEAEAEILANGGTVMGASYAGADDEMAPSSTSSSKSLWAALFGSSNEDDDNEAVVEKTASIRSVKRAVPVESDENDQPNKLVLKSPAQAIQSVAAVPLPSLKGYKLAAPGKAPLPPERPGAQLIAINPIASLPQKFAIVPLPPSRPAASRPTQTAANSLAPLPPKRVVFDGTETTGSLRNTTSADLPKVIADGRAAETPVAAMAYAPIISSQPRLISMPTPRPATAKSTPPVIMPTSLSITSNLNPGLASGQFAKTASALPSGKFVKLPLTNGSGVSTSN